MQRLLRKAARAAISVAATIFWSLVAVCTLIAILWGLSSIPLGVWLAIGFGCYALFWIIFLIWEAKDAALNVTRRRIGDPEGRKILWDLESGRPTEDFWLYLRPFRMDDAFSETNPQTLSNSLSESI